MNITEPEAWRPISRTNGAFEVSSFGRVRSATTLVVRRPYVRKSGHHAYTLRAPGMKEVCVLAHALVLEAFVGQRPAGAISRHLNGNPADNSVSNLAWGSHVENSADCKRHGRDNVGERNGMSRLTQEQVAAIRSSTARQCDLAKLYAVAPTTINSIRKGKSWAHV